MRSFTFVIKVILVTGLFSPIFLSAESVDVHKAKQVAENKLELLKPSSECIIISEKSFFVEGLNHPLFYVFELDPQGYIVISAETDLPPIIAYSFESNYSIPGNHHNPLDKLLKADLQNRLKNIPNIPDEIISERKLEWIRLIQAEPGECGGKALGPYIQTDWGQGQPYNNLCPMDPVTNERSIAGCPAVALAQIINYYETINESVFTDADDYYHSYAGRNYWIDDDFVAIDFPSFPQLNTYLDTLELCWQNQAPLKENEKAAINFACGVAAKQVYTSSIAGTFGVNQAFEAYIRLGFSEAKLIGENDTSLYTQLLQNMMDGRPAHLAVVDEAGTMGHNLIVDGYDDGYYHLNLGWNGSYNGYYLLPDEIPYGLTVIEGLILNIAFPPVYTSVSNAYDLSGFEEIRIYPNPAQDYIKVDFTLKDPGSVEIFIYSLDGSLVGISLKENLKEGLNTIHFDINNGNAKNLHTGMYFCQLRSGEKILKGKFVVR